MALIKNRNKKMNLEIELEITAMHNGLNTNIMLILKKHI